MLIHPYMRAAIDPYRACLFLHKHDSCTYTHVYLRERNLLDTQNCEKRKHELNGIRPYENHISIDCSLALSSVMIPFASNRSMCTPFNT